MEENCGQVTCEGTAQTWTTTTSEHDHIKGEEDGPVYLSPDQTHGKVYFGVKLPFFIFQYGSYS